MTIEAKNVRKRLEEATFPNLDAMMEAYAAAAVTVAREEFRQRLDFAEARANLNQCLALK